MSDHLAHVLITFALVLVVPGAVSLHLPELKRSRVIAAIGAVAATSFAVPRGPVAAALVTPWLFVAAALVADQVRRQNGWTAIAAARIVASAYMTVGAGWLLLSRYGAQPLDLGDEIVELTALHFHYAGFVAPVLIMQLIARLQREPSRHVRAAGFSLAASLIGMPLTSLGFVVSSFYGSVGATVLAAGLTTASVVTLTSVVPDVPRASSVALGISATSVVVAMLLAIVYSIGQWADMPAPSITTMVWTHGFLNSLGFALCGVVGWHLARGGRIGHARRKGHDAPEDRSVLLPPPLDDADHLDRRTRRVQLRVEHRGR